MSLRGYSEIDNGGADRNPWLYVMAVFCLFMILAIRLFFLQVIDYHLYLDKSEDYRIKRLTVEAPRGTIFDRNGEVLATNRMNYQVTIDPFEHDCFDETIPRLATLVPDLPRLMGVSRTALLDSIKTLARTTRNPVTIIQDTDFRTISLIEEHSLELPGVGCTIGQRRLYPYDRLACHVLGYMGKLTREEIERLTKEGYDRNQWIGKYGIEHYYEQTLKGENGIRFLEKNYLNRFLGTISDYQPIPPVPGEDITLTIDRRLQLIAEQAFGDTVRGAFVALDPRTGAVMVMVSAPSFDPNSFVSIMSSEKYAALVNDPQSPFYNRAIQGTYPPGSAFKMLTAIAGLENGYDEDTRFQSCHGYYTWGREYDCWNRDTGGHGSLAMIDAIAQSCNVYYYQLSRELGLERWSRVCGLFGFGRPTGIDLFGEVSGNLPSPVFYQESGITYFPGMMLNLAIGQGENDVTPLQLAHYAGIIATGGLDARPHLIKGQGEPPRRIEGISPHSFEVVREGMYGVVNYPQGTARSARVEGYTVAGKTGTAQNPHGESHRIFVAFAPFENPTVAVACVAENVGDVSPSLAVIFVQRFLTEYFRYYPGELAEMDGYESTAR